MCGPSTGVGAGGGRPLPPHEAGVGVSPPELRLPRLNLTSSKVMVIVWRLRVNIIRTVFIYYQRATSSVGTVNKNSSYIPVGP